MSAEDGEPRRKRTRMQAPREARKASTTTESPKRALKRHQTQNTPRDDGKGSKDVASTSKIASDQTIKESPSNLRETASGGRKTRALLAASPPPNKRSGKRQAPQNDIFHRHNVLHYLNSVTVTHSQNRPSSQFLHGPLIRSWSNLVPYSPLYGSSMHSPFKRRVTALVCHPVHPYLVVAGSKGGELVYYNLKNISTEKFIEGIGAGGSVVALKFHPEKPTSVYTASITGKVRCQDFCGVHEDILLDSMTWSNWFCSLDILPEKKIIIAGDSIGNLCAVSQSGDLVFEKKRIHKSKVTHAEICPKNTHLLVTSSTDHSVKLWDLRMFSSDYKSGLLYTLPHTKGVNSAYFSPSSSSLLTTDQYNEIKVYSSPWWDLETTIFHPHRHYQHLTPIKAAWHPMFDAVVIGRYPDKNFSESDLPTVDFYDAHTGKELYRLKSEDLSGIAPLNCFNCTGDVLASAFGHHIVFWHAKEEQKKMSPSSGNNPGAGAQRHKRNKSKKVMRLVKKKLA